MLLKIPQSTGQPAQQRMTLSQMSLVLRLRNLCWLNLMCGYSCTGQACSLSDHCRRGWNKVKSGPTTHKQADFAHLLCFPDSCFFIYKQRIKIFLPCTVLTRLIGDHSYKTYRTIHDIYLLGLLSLLLLLLLLFEQESLDLLLT